MHRVRSVVLLLFTEFVACLVPLPVSLPSLLRVCFLCMFLVKVVFCVLCLRLSVLHMFVRGLPFPTGSWYSSVFCLRLYSRHSGGWSVEVKQKSIINMILLRSKPVEFEESV